MTTDPTNMINPSPSYKPLPECCGQSPRHCDYFGTEHPCWGVVSMSGINTEEGTSPTHVCDGHFWYEECGEYEPEPDPAVENLKQALYDIFDELPPGFPPTKSGT